MPNFLTHRLIPLVASICLTALAACAQNPATGESQLSLVSPAEEKRIGRQQHPAILAQFGGEIGNARLNAYVDQVGRRVAAKAEMPAEHFTFTVLDSPIVNAFALPGGFIYITRGMLSVLNNEAELAGVLGHEIGHVTARHSASRQSWGILAGLAAAGVGALTNNRQAGQLTTVGAAGLLAGYSREQERQSDSLGIRYLNRSGYDPRGMTGVLTALQRQGELMSRMSGVEARSYSFLATHPQTPERIAATTREARSVKTGPNPKQGGAAYLDAIDGMIYGDSPDHGYALGARFAHPRMKLTFTAPDGFRLDNLPNAVVATRRGGGQRIIFDLESDQWIARSGIGMLDYIADHWARNTRLRDGRRLTVNGMPAAAAFTTASMNSRRVGVRLVAIRFSRDRIFRFLHVGPSVPASGLSPDFQGMIDSFRRLSDKEAQQLKPRRIKITRAAPGDDVKRLSRFDIADGFAADRFRAINAMDKGDKVKAGTRVKTIR